MMPAAAHSHWFQECSVGWAPRCGTREHSMLTTIVNKLLGATGLSLHRKNSIERLIAEIEYWRTCAIAPPFPAEPQKAEMPPLDPEPASDVVTADDCALPVPDFQKVIASPAERSLVDSIQDFGQTDYAALSFLFESNLTNFRVIGQRIDEAALLWRATKAAGGPILEVGRAQGGTTVLLLAASDSRQVISLDRGFAPAEISEHVFARPDVAARLTLYVQSSREEIAEDEFGFVFIDGDHSYEGLCHDIATFWNSLKSFDGRPPLAVFHDGVENPISFVPSVKKACDELMAEAGVARLVESAGSLLVLEKLRDLDRERWYGKLDAKAWNVPGSYGGLASPSGLLARLRPETSAPRKASFNALVNDDLDHPSWKKHGVTLEPFHGVGLDNPIQQVREAPQPGRHAIGKQVDTAAMRQFSFAAFVRPVGLRFIRLLIEDDERFVASVDLQFGDTSRILNPRTSQGFEILDAALSYQNAFFRCEMAVALSQPLPSANFWVMSLSDQGEDSYPGNPERGFFLNLASVREVH